MDRKMDTRRTYGYNESSYKGSSWTPEPKYKFLYSLRFNEKTSVYSILTSVVQSRVHPVIASLVVYRVFGNLTMKISSISYLTYFCINLRKSQLLISCRKKFDENLPEYSNLQFWILPS